MQIAISRPIPEEAPVTMTLRGRLFIESRDLRAQKFFQDKVFHLSNDSIEGSETKIPPKRSAAGKIVCFH